MTGRRRSRGLSISKPWRLTVGLGITAADHIRLILPLFHVNGIVVGTLTPLLAGGRVTVAGRFSPKTFLGLVERIRPTYFSAVPAIHAMLTSMPEAETADTSWLRLVVCGTAPMPAELIARVESTLGVVLVEGYGLSEGSCASTLNPYPREVETALYSHDGVLEAAVVGWPDDVLGEVVVAYVALRPGAEVTVEELHALCAEQLAKYKRPVLIEVLDELPKNAVGKIEKPALRALATA